MTMISYRQRDNSEVGEDEAFENGILKNGYGLRGGLMFRDGADGRRTRTLAVHRDPQGRLLSTTEAEEEELEDAATVATLADAGIRFHDGTGHPAGFRPGYCVPTDADMVRRRAAVEQAYRDAERADAEAWRNPKPFAGAGAQPAEPGLTQDALATMDAKELAYREVEERDRNAWRNAKP